MAARACIFLLIFFGFTRLTSDSSRELWVWNVGQGQWVTLVEGAKCWHFDVGGEKAPWPQIMRLCRARKNLVSLSHWDWDHVGLVGKARMLLPHICLLLPPRASPDSARKRKLIANMEACGQDLSLVPFRFWNGVLNKTANASSRVVIWKDILMPGDSSRDQEHFWAHELEGLSETHILVLGHHGSATSTGQDLLNALPHLRLAIASARYRRYGHPHQRVITDLARLRVPLLRTEDWGSIRIELP